MNWPTQQYMLEIKKYVNSKKEKDTAALVKDSKQWVRTAWANKMSYEITWLGIPIIQTPEDIILMQELIFKIQPDVIIETGVAHGGSLIFYASLLEILGRGKVIGVDIEIRKCNREAIEAHPLSKRIELVEGNSIAPEIVQAVKDRIPPCSKALVCLDSNHAKEHVTGELRAYHDIVTPGSYLVVFDTIMPDLRGLQGAGESWDKNNPLEAIKDFLKSNSDFEIDEEYNKLFVSHCPNGFLRKR